MSVGRVGSHHSVVLLFVYGEVVSTEVIAGALCLDEESWSDDEQIIRIQRDGRIVDRQPQATLPHNQKRGKTVAVTYLFQPLCPQMVYRETDAVFVDDLTCMILLFYGVYRSHCNGYFRRNYIFVHKSPNTRHHLLHIIKFFFWLTGYFLWLSRISGVATFLVVSADGPEWHYTSSQHITIKPDVVIHNIKILPTRSADGHPAPCNII